MENIAQFLTLWFKVNFNSVSIDSANPPDKIWITRLRKMVCLYSSTIDCPERKSEYFEQYFQLINQWLDKGNKTLIHNADAFKVMVEYCTFMRSLDTGENAFERIEPILKLVQKGTVTLSNNHFICEYVINGHVLFNFSDGIDNANEAKLIFEMKAKIYVMFEKYSEAIKVIKKLRMLTKDDDMTSSYQVSVLFHLGFTYELLNNHKEAFKCYMNMIGAMDKIEPPAKTVKECFHFMFRALHFIGKIKYQYKEYPLARLALEEFCSCFEESREILLENYGDISWWSVYRFEESLENLYESAKSKLKYIGNK